MSVQSNVPDSAFSGFIPTTITAGSVIFSDGSQLTGNTSSIFLDITNTRLGVGTSSPSNTLQVNSSKGITTLNAGNGAVEILSGGALNALKWYGANNLQIGYDSNLANIGNGAAGSNVMTFATSGFVGVGCVPSVHFHIKSASATNVIADTSSATAQILFGLRRNNTINYWELYMDTLGDGTNDFGLFDNVANALIFRVDPSTDYTGWGANSFTPGRRVDIKDTANPQLRITQGASAYAEFQADSGGVLTITTTGNSVKLPYLTAGQVVFPGTGGALTGSSSLFWDNTNYRIRLDSPTHTGGITWGTADGYFSAETAVSPFNGVNDNVLYIGYNRGHIAAPSDPSYMLSLESHYFDGVTHWMEWNWDYQNSSGTVNKRFFSQTINRTTHASQAAFLELDDFFLQNSSVYFARFTKTSQLIQFFNAAGVAKFIFDTTTLPTLTVDAARLHTTAASSNIFLGSQAGNYTLTATNCTGIGSTVFGALTSGAANTAVGNAALTLVTSGGSNTAVGSGALQTVTTNGSNCAFGASALSSNTAANNSAFGTSAMQNNTSGSTNSAFGFGALFTNTTAGDCSAFGFQALNASNGASCSAFGVNALLRNTSGANNCAFGVSALSNALTQGANCAFGSNALAATTGASSTAIGNSALNTATNGDNTAVGASAGSTVTTGVGCVFVGELADTTTGTFNFACAIGYSAKVGAASTMALGGTGANALSVCINQTTAARRLDVLDASNPQLRLTQAAASVYVDHGIDSTGLYTITPTGGSTSPRLKFANVSTAFYGGTPAAQGTGGQNVTNNVTDSGSTAGTIPDITDGVTYANDYTNLRRALFQLARMLKQDHDQLRAMGILT